MQTKQNQCLLQRMLDDSKGILTDLSGRTDITQHEVNLNTSDQIHNKPYQNPYAVKEAVRRQIQGLFGRLPFGVFCEEGWFRFVSIFSYVKMRPTPHPPPLVASSYPPGSRVNLHLLYLRMFLHNLQLFLANWFSRKILKYIDKISIILNQLPLKESKVLHLNKN